MTARNDITGDSIKSRVPNDAYRNNPFWDKVVEGHVAEKMEKLEEFLTKDAEKKGLTIDE